MLGVLPFVEDPYLSWSAAEDRDKEMPWFVNLHEIVDISDSREPESMTTIVTWQLRVTGLESQFLGCFIIIQKIQIFF